MSDINTPHLTFIESGIRPGDTVVAPRKVNVSPKGPVVQSLGGPEVAKQSGLCVASLTLL